LNQIVKWKVPSNHPAFAGHFPHMPILPGVVLLDMALHAIADAHQLDTSHYQINSVKFLSPVQPGETLTFEHNLSNQGMLSFSISANERKVAIGKIVSSLPSSMATQS
jgi:3-hydroxyacyl-[acyl-carrier-protein] dehydratase